MKYKNTERKCKDCDTIIAYIPRKVRCSNCHQKYLDNAMITTKNEDDFTKGKQYEYMKQAVGNLIKQPNTDAILDRVFKKK